MSIRPNKNPVRPKKSVTPWPPNTATLCMKSEFHHCSESTCIAFPPLLTKCVKNTAKKAKNRMISKAGSYDVDLCAGAAGFGSVFGMLEVYRGRFRLFYRAAKTEIPKAEIAIRVKTIRKMYIRFCSMVCL